MINFESTPTRIMKLGDEIRALLKIQNFGCLKTELTTILCLHSSINVKVLAPSLHHFCELFYFWTTVNRLYPYVTVFSADRPAEP